MNKLISIYDSKSMAYDHPRHFRTRGEFIRAFQEALKNPETTYSKYPEDFTAFEIGEWDEHTGTITMYEAKQVIGNGIELKQ